MSNEVAKQKSDSPYNIESFGRKSKTVSVLNLWYEDLQVVSGKIYEYDYDADELGRRI